MIAVMSAWCLSLHSSYRCQHAGACCSADWLIPAEEEVVRTVELRWIAADLHKAQRFDTGPRGRLVGRHDDGSCVFFDREGGRLCSIHRAAGADALPVACRHFPRTFLIDARGTFVSLSHFCPTAAALLLQRGPLRIVEALPPLRLEGPIEGLDAIDALPPLVRPGLLADLDGYGAWERAAIATLGRDDLTTGQALDLLASATEAVRTWRPGGEPLTERVHAAFSKPADSSSSPPRVDAMRLLTRDWVPPESGPVGDFDDVWRELIAPMIGGYDRVVRNYLAARLFGAWMSYQARGLRSIVFWLRACEAVLKNEIARRAAASDRRPTTEDVVEAVRAADLLLLHAIDSQEAARSFAPLEEVKDLAAIR